VALDLSGLADISDDSPGGEDVEFDADFVALEGAAKGKPEVQYGDTIEPAVPPDWKEVRALATGLLERTRDLRVLTHLAVARLHLDGLPGFAEVLFRIRDQLENRWEQVHPRLDPEDDNDPTLRANALFRLQDPGSVVRPLRDLPLAASPMTGPVSWRDIAIFGGHVEPEEGREKMTETFIRGAFSRTNPERLALLTEAAEVAAREVKAIPAVFEDHAGAATGPDFSVLGKLLGEIQRDLKRFEPAADAPQEEEEEAPAAEAGGGGEEMAPATGGGGGGARGGRGFASIRSITAVTTREDALHLLELVSGYFRTSEPSSPVPMLVDRARRLAGMDFMAILQELAPDGIGQAQVVAGPQPDQQVDQGY
jgi:type VI secretion system protein ImpA